MQKKMERKKLEKTYKKNGEKKTDKARGYQKNGGLKIGKNY